MLATNEQAWHIRNTACRRSCTRLGTPELATLTINKIILCRNVGMPTACCQASNPRSGLPESVLGLISCLALSAPSPHAEASVRRSLPNSPGCPASQYWSPHLPYPQGDTEKTTGKCRMLWNIIHLMTISRPRANM